MRRQILARRTGGTRGRLGRCPDTGHRTAKLPTYWPPIIIIIEGDPPCSAARLEYYFVLLCNAVLTVWSACLVLRECAKHQMVAAHIDSPIDLNFMKFKQSSHTAQKEKRQVRRSALVFQLVERQSGTDSAGRIFKKRWDY